ncbi:uncharacterized protein LOC122872112 isoform X2 [Siniperca chuatsi]|uniref:uncharacterized protein LOC122872112 isoform X2 n=1 Tax=Siniperca chuatsi TaxID=119488 RepID=UPI001CE03BDF|nr:uncharacterized protein LOC122872112 isoform X2 [Siniperca chuatsi]
MDQWKLWFVLLLPLCLCFDSEDILVKTIGSEPDVTPICTNATLSIITLIVCKISTERNGGAECRLLYGHGWDFVHECDSRFTLKTKNQTVFLHLTSLKPEDRGNYTCECSHLDGVYILHLNITVEAASHEQDFSSSFFRILPIIVIGGVTASIIVIGLVLKGILRKIHSRDDTRSAASGLTVCEPPCSLTGNDEREREKRISHVTNVPRSMVCVLTTRPPQRLLGDAKGRVPYNRLCTSRRNLL